MIEIPLGLRHALESGQCVLFVGAGAGANLLGPDGKTAPDGTALASEMAAHFGIETEGITDLAKIAEFVELTKGRTELETFLRKRLDGLEPDEHLKWLPTVRWKAIYTTNYDQGLERAYELTAKPVQTTHIAAGTADLTSLDLRFQLPIYHLHGTLFGRKSPQLILTQRDYARFREGRRMLFELLKNDFATSTVLYIGYSNRDPNWQMVLEEISAEFYPSPMPASYRVAPGTGAMDKALLRAKNVETIDSTFKEFVEAATLALMNSKADATTLKKAHEAVPSDLSEAFEQNPAATARLLNSWIYVNQAAFNETANIQSFLRGDRANWGLIGRKLYFERDIEEQLYDDLLDYATSGSKRPQVEVVLGSAGYGTSTLLMAIAGRVVTDRAGPLFMLRPGATVVEGDVEFASTLLKGRPFFFVENAADHSDELYSAVHRLRETEKPAMFVFGERLNEWRQGRGKLAGKEVEIEALSNPETLRLLEFLGQHNALNALEPLSRELQIAAIENKHGKELLVVMREATEGKSFDAILEDEFQGIQSEMARRAYLYVCCFYQHGAYVRDLLLASLLNVSVTQLYEYTKDGLEGVVAYDCIDEANGRYAARARHRTIATVVWERCGSGNEKEEIVQTALQSMNLNYRADVEAFENFVRSDRIVDEIHSLDGKIKFFNTACHKDPESPYVRQHYSRMLLRAGKAELALSQIDEALKLNANVRVLYHTKGVVLSHLARTIPSKDLARKRLTQSEEAFRRGIMLNKRDEYSYSGLAELYLESLLSKLAVSGTDVGEKPVVVKRLSP